jgi:tetratricopeptide (TPR) repeat protein
MNPPTIVDLQRLLKLQETALGAQSPEVGETLAKIADLYSSTQQYQQAEELYNKAIAILQKGPELYQKEASETKSKLQAMLARLNKCDDQGVEVDTIEMRKDAATDKVVPVQKPQKFSTYNDAIADAEIQLALLEQTGGDNHIYLADCLTRLADLYCRSQMTEKMEPLLIQALNIRERALGPADLSVATAIKNLALLYFAQQKYELAEPLLKRALNIRKQKLGDAHPSVLSTIQAYDNLLARLRDQRLGRTGNH